MSEVWYALFEDPAYRHVLLNHLPITGLAVAACALAFGIFEDRWQSIVVGLALCLVTSGSAVFVMQTGDAAYPQLFDQLDGHGQGWLDHHVFLAERLGRLLPANALLAGLAVAVGQRRMAWRRPLGIGVLATTLAALVAGAVVAEAGGKIRHAEFRTSEPPVHETPGRIR